jgi:hypothetical protein
MRHDTFLHRGNFRLTIASWAGAAVLVAALGVVGLSSGPIAAATTTTPACTTANLVVWLNTSGSGTAGSSYYSLNFTNLSAHSCTLTGYPGVSAISQAGIQLGSAASRNSALGTKVITLTSARTAKEFDNTMSSNTATAILQITVAQNFPAATCSYATSAGLRVYPPGQKESTVITYPFVACSTSGPRYLHVESMQRYVDSPN